MCAVISGMFGSHEGFSCHLTSQCDRFVMCPIQIGGTGLHSGPQKQNSNWCDRSRVRVHCVMKWHSLYQSVSHSVTPVVPECHSSTQAGALPLGNSHSSPFVFFFSPFSTFFLTSFYFNFTSCPFSVYYFLISNSGSQRREWERGKQAKRCGYFLSFLARRYFALFLHTFFLSQPFPLSFLLLHSHQKLLQSL